MSRLRLQLFQRFVCPSRNGDSDGGGVNSKTSRAIQAMNSLCFLTTLIILQFGALSTVPVLGLEVRPVLFTKFADAITSSTDQKSSVETPIPQILFLHGRLEPERGEDPIDAPSVLYADFIEDLLSQQSPGSVLLMPEYDRLLSQRLNRESKDLRLGPVSSQLSDCIDQYISKPVVLISFSMGAAMALKLLKQNTNLRTFVSHVVLVEPVWRCWLPFAEQEPLWNTDDERPVLAIYGTRDKPTLMDSGNSVEGSLRRFFPLKVVPIENGNHWSIVSDRTSKREVSPLLQKIVTEDLPDGVHQSEIRKKLVQEIATFCRWQK